MKHIFIRHPPIPDMQGICYGSLDIRVSLQEIERHAQQLKSTLPTLPVFSSPLQRCFDLAKSIDPGAKHDRRLLEMNFGHWQGKAWNTIARSELDCWAQDVANYRAPGGENFNDVVLRFSNFLNELEQPHILVTHAGVIRAAHYVLGGRSQLEAAAIEVPYVTSVSF